MSHELRTPLNAILGFAQVLDKANDPPLPGKQRESVAHILQGGHHLLGLINEVLDLSAIEAGRLHVDLADVPLAPLLRECLALVSPQAADREVRIEAGDPGSLSVYADRTRLKQVLLNLLSNGVKYNRPGGRLGIDFSEHGDNVCLAIADTGRGIPDDLAERIFRPFDRLGVNQVEGTGIGLAITRRLVELMGGRIDFTSQVGVGTTFRVEFARREGTTTAADTDPRPGPSLTTPADTPAGPPAPATGHTLLAIGVPESDAGMLRLVASTLRETTLLLAGTVDDAGIQLAKQRFQAIIADESVLPALGAIDTRGLPLVVLGADPAPEDWAGEGRHWQRKPLKPRDMARILRELLQ
jgi:two-component sensor histidine kinase